MTNESRKERVEKWQKLIDEYLASSMTQKSFCDEHDLNLPQFVYYLGFVVLNGTTVYSCCCLREVGDTITIGRFLIISGRINPE